jgi:hypothetical protein
MLEQRGRQVPLTRVGHDDDEPLAGGLGARRDLQRRRHRRARRHPGEDSLTRREFARHPDGVVELGVEHLVHHRPVEHVGHEVRPDALDAVTARAPLGEHGGVLRLDEHDLDVGVALLEHLAHAGHGAAGTGSRDEHVDVPVGVAPDLLGRRPAVDRRVRLVFELPCENGARPLGGDALRGLDGLGHALVRVGEDEFGAVRLEQGAALLRHRGGHREHHLVAAGGADERQGDAGVAARRLDDGAARLQLAGLLGRLDQGVAETVLHRRAGVVELELDEDLGVETLGQCVETHQRRLTERGGDVGVDAGHGCSQVSRCGGQTTTARRRPKESECGRAVVVTGQSSRRSSKSAVDR